MEAWEHRQAHWVCVEDALKTTGVVARNGMVLEFHGPAFFAYLAQRGHSCSEYERCDCQKAKVA